MPTDTATRAEKAQRDYQTYSVAVSMEHAIAGSRAAQVAMVTPGQGHVATSLVAQGCIIAASGRSAPGFY